MRRVFLKTDFLSICVLVVLHGLSTTTGAAQVPVTFGTPDNLQIGAPSTQLPPTATWNMGWDYANTGKPTIVMSVTMNEPHWVPPVYNSATIIPSSSGHAVDTNGAGTDDRFVFTPDLPGVSISYMKVKEKANQGPVRRSYELEVGLDDGHGNDNGTDNNVLLFDIDISSPTGWTFNSEPIVSTSNNVWEIDTQAALVPPGGTTDPNTPDEVSSMSASAVPEPASMSLLGIVGLMALRRRRE